MVKQEKQSQNPPQPPQPAQARSISLTERKKVIKY